MLQMTLVELQKNANTGAYGSRLTFVSGYNGGYNFAALETENNRTGRDLRFYTADSSGALTRKMIVIRLFRQWVIGKRLNFIPLAPIRYLIMYLYIPEQVSRRWKSIQLRA